MGNLFFSEMAIHNMWYVGCCRTPMDWLAQDLQVTRQRRTKPMDKATIKEILKHVEEEAYNLDPMYASQPVFVEGEIAALDFLADYLKGLLQRA